MVRFPYVWGYREILPKIFFLNKATKVSKQLLPVYIAIAKSFQSKVVVQRKTWSTFQGLAVTPADKFVQKWHRTRNETFPKVANIKKSFCRKVLTTKCSIFKLELDDHGFHCTALGSRSQNPRDASFPANSRSSRFILGKIAKWNTREMWLMIFRFSRNKWEY